MAKHMVLFETLTRPVTPENVKKDPLPHVPEALAARLKELLLPKGDVWIAPLAPSNFRLSAHYDVRGEAIQKIEVFEKRAEVGSDHARVYVTPLPDRIPTLLIGEFTSVALYAWRDKTTAIPLAEEAQEIVVGGVNLTYPDSLVGFPGIAEILGNHRRIMYTIRPSSFWLQELVILTIAGQVVKAKGYRNHFEEDKIFWHITSADEWKPMLPDVPLHGAVLTNSVKHIEAHPELRFTITTDK